jgi:solute carrier family 14 (urea transporter)/urea transporter
MEIFADLTCDAAKEDPEFNLSGLAYVFRLLFMGTMPWANRVFKGKAWHMQALTFLVTCLRGIGQVFFMNNPLTGLLILVAIVVQSRKVAVFGILGLLSSNLLAIALRFEDGMIESGLFGYNGVLVGLAIATFGGDGEDSYQSGLVLATILTAMFSTVIFVSIGRLLLPYKVPPFTLPFNVAVLVYLLASAQIHPLYLQKGKFTLRLRPLCAGCLPALPDYTNASRLESASAMPSVREFFEAVPKGVGQVFLADKTISGWKKCF